MAPGKAKARQRLRFTAEFLCVGDGGECGRLLEVRTFLAIVQGDGLEFRCPYCLQTYVVTENGATPVDKALARTFTDAIGQPYRVVLPDDAPKLSKAALRRAERDHSGDNP